MLGRDVVRRRASAPATSRRARARRARHHRRARRSSGAVEPSSPDAVVNCAAYTDVDGAEATTSERDRRQRRRRRASSPRRRPRRRAPRWSTPPPTTSSTARKRTPLRRVRRDRPALRLRPLEAGRRDATVAAANPRHFIVRTSWLFGVAGKNFVETMLRLGASSDEVMVVARPGRLPDLHAATWRGRSCGSLGRRASSGSTTSPAAGSCSWFEFAQRDLRPGRRRVPACSSATSEMLARPAPRPAYSVLGSERDAPDPAARLATRACATTSRERAQVARMKLLVTGGAGFIGSTYVRHRARRAPRRHGRGARQAHLRRPPREPRRTVDGDRLELVEGDIADRDARRERDRGLRRDRQLRRRVARRPLDRGAGRVHPDRRLSAPSCCSRPRASAGVSATCRSRPTRSTARSRRAPSPRARRSTRPRPTRRRRPAATCSCRRLPPHLRHRRR